jgi:hypothetical protein
MSWRTCCGLWVCPASTSLPRRTAGSSPSASTRSGTSTTPRSRARHPSRQGTPPAHRHASGAAAPPATRTAAATCTKDDNTTPVPPPNPIRGSAAYERRLRANGTEGRERQVNQIEQMQQHLRAADGVPAVLSAGWEVFELVQAVAAACADQSTDMYPAFTFARGAAVSGRNAIAFAPSMPAEYAAPSGMTMPVAGDVDEVADDPFRIPTIRAWDDAADTPWSAGMGFLVQTPRTIKPPRLRSSGRSEIQPCVNLP